MPAALAPAQSHAVGAGSTALGLALLQRLRDRPGNQLLSPINLYGSLQLLGSGAGGETAAAIARVLRLPAGARVSPTPLEPGFDPQGSAGGPQLLLAQSLWPSISLSLRPAFAQQLARDFGATITPLDFSGDPAGAAQRINAWVADRTEGRIRELVVPGQLPANTRLALLSSIWFRGQWRSPFEPEATRNGRFQLAGGGTVSVPLMRQTGRFRFGSLPGGRLLELPYDDVGREVPRASLLILLPDRPGGLPALERQLSPALLERAIAAMQAQRVTVVLPRFRLNARTDLTKLLETLGLALAFSPQADFSGISSDGGLFVSSVLQQASLRVDEAGSEAAAATLVVAPVLGLIEDPIPEFRADRPFLLLIRHQPSGALLFVGRVQQPERL